MRHHWRVRERGDQLDAPELTGGGDGGILRGHFGTGLLRLGSAHSVVTDGMGGVGRGLHWGGTLNSLPQSVDDV